MRYLKITLLLASLSLPAFMLGACADRDEPTSPVSVTSADGKRSSRTSTTLVSPTTTTEPTTKETAYVSSWWPVTRDVPSWEDIFDSQEIGSKGGTLKTGDVTLTIPKGALAEDTQLYMMTLQGDKMYVLFWPHGLKFAKPATLSFAVDQTDAKDALASDLKGVYFESLFEEVPTELENFSVNKNGSVVNWDINHFSYYSVYVRRGYTAAGAD